MKIANVNELPEAIKRLNPHLFVGGVEKSLTKPNLEEALGGKHARQKASRIGLVISLVRYASKRLDSDNLAGGLKPLRDLIAATIGIDDGDERLRWEYGQVETRGQQGVMVKIEEI